MVLNEVDKDMEGVIPKTDCRLRPDIRAMENGEIGNASRHGEASLGGKEFHECLHLVVQVFVVSLWEIVLIKIPSKFVAYI